MCTTIGREYTMAHALGFSTDDLLGFTRNAICAAFIAPQQRTALLSAPLLKRV
jgi:adenosine deaminase